MREIKFRAWHKKYNCMVVDYDNWVDFGGHYWTTPDRVYDTPHQEIVNGNDIELMQFTGLKDKDGKEIYEGDIVRTKYMNGYQNVEVRFNHGSYVLKFKDLKNWKYLAHRDGNSEVIGNIYENPELLEEKHE